MATKKKQAEETAQVAEMAEKAKQLAESVSSHTATLVQQAILEHYGQNSAEYRFALMQVEPTKVIYNPEDVSKEQIDNLISSEAMRGDAK